MNFSPLIEQLIEALRCLPGVGPKSARRMAFYLLEHERESGTYLANALHKAISQVQYCKSCRILSETELCQICANQARDPSMLCIIESPNDVIAIEQTSSFRGYYFVLLGHLSPLDGVGPDDIGIPQLKERLRQQHLQEVIIATNPTVEGEATAHYIAELIKPFKIKVSRIACGIPIGGELEYIDGGTIARALIERDRIT